MLCVKEWQGTAKGLSTQGCFSTPKWKIVHSYVLLIAEKKCKETYKQDSRFNAPSVTRANTKKRAVIPIIIKNAENLNSGPMEEGSTQVARRCETGDSRGHPGRPLLFGTTLIYEAVCLTVTRNVVCSYVSKHAGMLFLPLELLSLCARAHHRTHKTVLAPRILSFKRCQTEHAQNHI